MKSNDERAVAAEIIRDIVSERFDPSARVVNCIVHMNLAITERPDGCRLCLTDIRNYIEYTLRTNAWLNDKLDRIREVLHVEHD